MMDHMIFNANPVKLLQLHLVYRTKYLEYIKRQIFILCNSKLLYQNVLGGMLKELDKGGVVWEEFEFFEDVDEE